MPPTSPERQTNSNNAKRHRECYSPHHTPTLSEYGTDSARLWQIMDKRLKKQGEVMIENMKLLLDETKRDIIKTLEEKIGMLKNDINVISERVSAVEKLIPNIQHLKEEIVYLKNKMLKQENSFVSCDIRLNGIPHQPNENLVSIFYNICDGINYTRPKVCNIYRQKIFNRQNNAIAGLDGNIMIKLATPYEKNAILKAVGRFKRTTKTQLLLKHAGFQSDSPIYLNENLTQHNFTLLRNAIRLKKQKQLAAAYSLKGLVHVKRNESDAPTCIMSNEDLSHIVNIQPNTSSSFRDPVEKSNQN